MIPPGKAERGERQQTAAVDKHAETEMGPPCGSGTRYFRQPAVVVYDVDATSQGCGAQPGRIHRL
jgi:hypothetical protein